MLKKEDGQKVRVFLNQLSKEDQDYVASLKQTTE